MLATWHHGEKDFMSRPPADGGPPIAMAATPPQARLHQPGGDGSDPAAAGGKGKAPEGKGGGKASGRGSQGGGGGKGGQAAGAGKASARGSQGGGGATSEFEKLVRETQKRKLEVTTAYIKADQLVEQIETLACEEWDWAMNDKNLGKLKHLRDEAHEEFNAVEKDLLLIEWKEVAAKYTENRLSDIMKEFLKKMKWQELHSWNVKLLRRNKV